MKKISLFLLMTLFATLSFSADSITRKVSVTGTVEKEIMPDTAKLIARQMGETYNPAALTDMNTNVRYGTFYLSMIQGQLSGNPVLATAGYNAGPNRARRWQPEFQPIAADQYTESIPLAETRDYVKQVMTNATHYGVLLGQGPQSIAKRMNVIPLRNNP